MSMRGERRPVDAIHRIAKRMKEKFKPLIETGKISEAETESDRLLELLYQDGKRL